MSKLNLIISKFLINFGINDIIIPKFKLGLIQNILNSV